MPKRPTIKDSLSFGSAGLTSLPSLKSALSLLETAYDCGIVHYDTAPLYGKGYSENILGIFARNNKINIKITTKFGIHQKQKYNLPLQIALPLNYYYKNYFIKNKKIAIEVNRPIILQPRMISKTDIQKSLESSLKKLGLDNLEGFLLHEGIPSFLTDEALYYLISCKKEGKINKIGLGTNNKFIINLKTQDLDHWDILQYHKNETSDILLKKFNTMTHIHHSCISNPIRTNENLKAGAILAKCAEENPNGRILFFSRNKANIKNNILEFNENII